MKSPFVPSFFDFEQELRDEKASRIREKQAARAIIVEMRAARKKVERDAKDTRKRHRESIAKAKAKGRELSAQCGVNFYSGNSGWKNCLNCGQPIGFLFRILLRGLLTPFALALI